MNKLQQQLDDHLVKNLSIYLGEESLDYIINLVRVSDNNSVRVTDNKDAERYRWLKGIAGGTSVYHKDGVYVVDASWGDFSLLTGDDLDAEIDERMKAEK